MITSHVRIENEASSGAYSKLASILIVPIMLRKLLCIAVLTAPLGLALPAQSALPQPPCGKATTLTYPPPAAAPTITIWHQVDLEKSHWQPPSCTGWSPSSHSKLVIALAGSFRSEGSIDRVLARMGAISALRNIQYWSTTDKKWRPIAFDASALASWKKNSRRPDFSAADLVRNADLYYWENDSRSGEIVYRLRVYEMDPDRAVIVTENITAVRKLFFTVFNPGSLQSTIFIQRVSPGLFGIYILSRTDESASIFAAGHEDSYVNRAAALFRYLAGIRTDQEPPAAP